MRGRDDLYKLIKSLSKSEKRYFSLDAQKSGAKSSNYVQLFQAYNEMADFDESALRQQFPNLSSDKAYLYESILQSMRDYRSPKSKAAQIKERILDAKFLYERGLYDQCEERLQSAKLMAESLGDSLSRLEINREERRLYKESEMKRFRENFQNLKAEKDDLVRSVKDEFHYLDLYDRISLDVASVFQYSKEAEKENLAQELSPQSWTVPEGKNAEHRFLQVNAFFYHLLGESEKSESYFLKTVEWWDKNPDIKNDEFFRYIADLSNLLAVYRATGKIAQMRSLLERLENESPETFHEKNLMFQRIMIYQFNYYLQQGDFLKLNQLVKEVDSGLKNYLVKDRTKISLLYQVASACFLQDDFEQSERWLEKILDYRGSQVRQDIQVAAVLLKFICLLESEKSEDLENFYRSVQRILKSKKSLPFGKVDLWFFDKIKDLFLTGKIEQRGSAGKFLEQINELKNTEKRLPIFYDLFRFWLYSKKENKPIQLIYKDL